MEPAATAHESIDRILGKIINVSVQLSYDQMFQILWMYYRHFPASDCSLEHTW